MAKLSELLRERGYVYQHSSETLEEITDGPKRTLYLGIDPSADSLHVGQLQAFLVLRRFLEAGHKVILLIGGGTGMIGDPGGRSSERNLLEAETVGKNGEAIAAQAKKLFGGADFLMANNAEWLSPLRLIDFLRDVGKHFSVNAMVQRDAVRDRLANPDQGISFTEFSYMLLQSYDFAHLHEEYGCDVQVGGSDQWGNIVSGVDYIRRAKGDTVYALTWPLVVNKATGKKFGKSEGGAVWLDPMKTTPFQFYQFFYNTEDETIEDLLLRLTLLPKDEITDTMQAHAANPAARIGQRRLAHEVTLLVHGERITRNVQEASDVLFGPKGLGALSAETSELVRREAPTCETKLGEPLYETLVRSGLAASKREARQFIEDGAVYMNEGKVSGVERVVMKEDFENAPLALLKRGKRNVCLLTLG